MESNPSGFQPEKPVPAQVFGSPRPRPRRSGLRTLLILLLLTGLAGSAVLNLALLSAGGGVTAPDDQVREELFSNYQFESGKHKIAIISLEGTILSGEGTTRRQIERAAQDEDVKAVVLRVNSPGGTITGSDYLYHHLKKLRETKPIVVSMGGIAASGGYYVAMAVGETPNTIFAEPTTWTGSIGVIIPHYNASELLSEWGVQEDSIASHRLKNMGSLAKEMTDEERDIFQVLVDESFGRFKEIIKAGRPHFQQDPEALDKLATGQVYTAEQALANGLIDEIGFVEKAIQRAIELANVEADDVQVVCYKPQVTLAGLLFGGVARHQDYGLAELLDVTAPRAYYLSTWMPLLLRGGP